MTGGIRETPAPSLNALFTLAVIFLALNMTAQAIAFPDIASARGEGLRDLFRKNPVFATLWVCAAGPFLEEVIFRYGADMARIGALGPLASVIVGFVSSTIFGFQHEPGLLGCVFVVAGLFYWWIAYCWGLRYSVFAHAANNTLVILFNFPFKDH